MNYYLSTDIIANTMKHVRFEGVWKLSKYTVKLDCGVNAV